MNVERLTKLAEWLEAGAPHETMRFDMSKGLIFVNSEGRQVRREESCGTACCIAGAAVQFFAPEFAENSDFVFPWSVGLAWDLTKDKANTLLELDHSKSRKLFMPDLVFGGELSDYSDPAWVARVIRNLIATGEVDWDAARHPDSAVG